jgi:2-polyprenyl-3-methyl-5-hydroxy-6-metoxy-1,4-benzoquinol methylase
MTDKSKAHDDVAACWNQNADQWTADVRGGFDIYRDLFTFPAFQAFVPPLAGLDVIDFGCGEGTNTRRLAQMGARMTGIDISERLIEYARKAEEADPLGITYKVTSYSVETGFPAGAFDAVVSTMALMDGPDFDGAMGEAFRLVRPGGFVAFSILHPCFITPGLRWEEDEAGRTIGLRVARYFDRASFVERWRFKSRSGEGLTPFAVPRFPRTMSDYINGVANAGFRICRIEEPQPSEEACKAAPRLRKWRDIAGVVLMVLAERPA